MKNKKLKICYMGDATSQHLKFWAEEFTKLGHEVHVISPYNAEIKGVEVHPTKTKLHKSINFILSYFIIRKLIKKIAPDVIHAHYLGTFSFLGALTGFHPFIGTVWGSDLAVFRKRNFINNLLLGYILKKSDLIEVADKTTCDFLNKNYKLKGKKVDVPYWGVNTEEFKPRKRKKDTNILYLRKSSEKYSTDVLIEALNLVRKKFPKIMCILKRDKRYARAEELISKYKLEKNIKDPGWIPDEDLPKVFNSSLIYIDSFHRNTPGGGMGITTMEAMACGLPVILADNPGVSDFVKHNHNGLIYKGGDYKELSECIIKLLKSRELREKLGKNARKTIINELNWSTISKKIEKKYFELAEKYEKFKE